MSFLSLLVLQAVLASPDTAPPIEIRFVPPAAPSAAYLEVTGAASLPGADTTRRHAIVYSEMYGTRLTIHKWASWALLPLVAGEYVVGQKLYTQPVGSEPGLRGTHQLLASGIEGLFAVNTVTGAWNLWEARHDPADRTRRWIHGVSMLVADLGYVVAAGTAPGDDCREGGGVCAPNTQRAATHRGVAIGAFGLSTASWLMMLLWKN